MTDVDSQADAGGLALSPEEQAALAEEVDLEPAMRQRILQMHRDIGRIDHYALLGVERTADRKEVKRAYYDLAARFHPDRYFRKRLGTFKARVEAVFQRITLAHDTLTDGDKRAEYDAYLTEQRRSRSIEELLTDALEDVRRAEEKAERAAREQGASPRADSTPPSIPAPAPRPSSIPRATPAPTSPPPVAGSPSGPTREVPTGARRDTFARRLLGGRPLPAPRAGEGSRAAPTTPPNTGARPSGAPPSVRPAPPSPTEAMEALRRRYEERVAQAKGAQAREYVAVADGAIAKSDWVAAANAFRVARSLLPRDQDIERRAKDAQGRADTILADTYAKQALYEEKNGQWAEAARSWQHVAKARPTDAHAHERGAYAIAKAGGNLHDAAHLAQQAVALDGQNHRYRTTLASVYIAAGLSRNARRELEAAAQLAPHDDTIRALLNAVGKSE